MEELKPGVPIGDWIIPEQILINTLEKFNLNQLEPYSMTKFKEFIYSEGLRLAETVNKNYFKINDDTRIKPVKLKQEFCLAKWRYRIKLIPGNEKIIAYTIKDNPRIFLAAN
jgi:hypothetical protein